MSTQSILEKPTVNNFGDDDKLFINHDNALRQIPVEDAGFATTEELESKQDVLTFDNAPTANSNNPVKSGGVKSALDQKANIDGYYESLGSGTADQLPSNIFEEDSEPYQFRTSGGSIDIGDRETDMLVGGSIAWNQLIGSLPSTTTTNGITFTKNNDGSVTVNGTATTDAVYDMTLNLHKVGKYLMQGCPSGGSVDTYYLGNISYSDIGNGYIANITSAPSGHGFRIYVKNGTTVNNLKFYPQIFCLTQMFGSTIADYIYTLEQGQAGAGVAFFRKYFPKPYYPYDVGTIKSVEGVSAHKTVGFNQWDEEWEVGKYNNTTGEKIVDTQRIRSKNKIPIVPNTTYYAKWGSFGGNYGIVFFYDANETYITYATPNASTHLFTTPSDAKYMTFYVSDLYGTTYKNDLCINLSWDGERDGEYEPYVEHSYPLDDSLTLRGVFQIENGKLKAYGDEYPSDGNGTERFMLVDLGTLNWSYSSLFGGCFTATLSTMKLNSAQSICSKYTNVFSGSAMTSSDKVIYTINNGNAIYIKDSAYSDATTFTSAMSGVYLVCEKSTPTPFTATPFTNPQIVDYFGTEEYVTTSIVPVGHYTQYMANLKAKLEMSPDSPNGAGDYIVRQTNGENEYVSLASNATIQDIIARLEALEGGGE